MQTAERPAATGTTARPAELFAEYCASIGVEDARVQALFDELHDELTTSGSCGLRGTTPCAPCCWTWTASRRSAIATTVDFTDADYFALVGPTGSGKSTVIDAMTFALYGTVPRWARQADGRVRAGPDRQPRHRAAGVRRRRAALRRRPRAAPRQPRRRAASRAPAWNGFSTRTRPAPSTTPTEVLAADGRRHAAVEKLLGLTFDHFCQCVVLPQGEFAEFLRAKGSERREILLKLLGAGLYKDIGQAANSRASLAADRATLLADQLTELADATADAAARRRAAGARPDRADRQRHRRAAAARRRAGRAGAAARAHLRSREPSTPSSPRSACPTASPNSTQRITAAHRVAATARACEQDAHTADTSARDRVAAAPARGPLEQARRDHAEQRRVVAALPTARTAAAAASASSSTRSARARPRRRSSTRPRRPDRRRAAQGPRGHDGPAAHRPLVLLAASPSRPA